MHRKLNKIYTTRNSLRYNMLPSKVCTDGDTKTVKSIDVAKITDLDGNVITEVQIELPKKIA